MRSVATDLAGAVGVLEVRHRDRVRGVEAAQRRGAVAGRLPVHRAEHRDLRGGAVDAELRRRPARTCRRRAWPRPAPGRPTPRRARGARSGRGRRARTRGPARRRPRGAGRPAGCADPPTPSSGRRRRRSPTTRRAAGRRRRRARRATRSRRSSRLARPCATTRSASTTGWASRSASSRQARVSGTSMPDPAQQRLDLAGAAQVEVGARGRVAQHAASRAARWCRGSASVLGRGPTNAAMISSAAARSTGRPSAASSAHSSSAADSDRAVATAHRAVGEPGQRRLLAASPRRAPAPPRASRSGRRPAQPPSTQSGSRWPSVGRGTSGSARSSAAAEQVRGPSPGGRSIGRSWSSAQIRPGSARQPPNRSRCTAATSQHTAIRVPAAISAAAVSWDHTTHRGRIAASAVATRSAASPLQLIASPATATPT